MTCETRKEIGNRNFDQHSHYPLTLVNCVCSGNRVISIAQPKSMSRTVGTWEEELGLQGRKCSNYDHTKSHLHLHFHNQEVVRLNIRMDDLTAMQVVNNVQNLAREVHCQGLVHDPRRCLSNLIVDVQERSVWREFRY